MKKRLFTLLLVVATFILVACTPAVEEKYRPTHFDVSDDLDYEVEEILDERITTIVKNELDYINQKYNATLILPDYKVYKVVENTPLDNMVLAETRNGNIYLYSLYFSSPSSAIENIAHEAVHLLYQGNYGTDALFAKEAGDHSYYGVYFQEAYADIISRDFMREYYPDEPMTKVPSYWFYVVQVEGLDLALNEATASYFVRNDYEGLSNQINKLAEAKGQALGEDTCQLFAAVLDKAFDRTRSFTAQTIHQSINSGLLMDNMSFIARCLPEDKLSSLGDVIARNGIILNGFTIEDLAKPLVS